MSQANFIYINKTSYNCKVCGILVTPENYYGTGQFCGPKCNAIHGLTFCNTKESRKKATESSIKTKLQKEQEKIKKLEPYNCENCGITVQPENYYGSGRFCCSKCARSFSSRYANTEEKRKEKSNTLKTKTKELILHTCPKCNEEFYSTSYNKNVLCEKCRKIN